VECVCNEITEVHDHCGLLRVTKNPGRPAFPAVFTRVVLVFGVSGFLIIEALNNNSHQFSLGARIMNLPKLEKLIGIYRTTSSVGVQGY
jgi:hypothetical protein